MATKAVAKKEETGVAAGSIAEWAVAQYLPEEIRELLDVEGGEPFGPRDLEIIKIPSGGATIWDIPTLEGRDGAKSFDAVILYYHNSRKCWTAPYGQGVPGPPDCESFDGLTGVGSPGGGCQGCVYNRRRQSRDDVVCAPRKNVFLLMSELALPVLIDLPVTSLAPWDKYIRELRNRMQLPWRVITKFELTSARALTGNEPYAKLELSKVANIPKEQQMMINDYREAFKATIEATYATRKQIHRELTQGAGGAQQQLWDVTPSAADDDDLPELGDGDLPPTDAQLDYIASRLSTKEKLSDEEVQMRLDAIETQRDASEAIEALK